MLNPEHLGIFMEAAIARCGLETGIDRPGEWRRRRRQSVPEYIVWGRPNPIRMVFTSNL
ncbi:hypothetical protein [Lyngbya sp. CCY1209]|uniref:hypothetical protein n=1 Tax=Lyngbya sp. CCY1209 TaxID=2886103 RepID=UPI002D20105D|nr:hypothetical protein [Lyngbya sp. CCY1209]MEB3883822.1 hypothetical protein [Lyngbya sp. CCY1209]